MSFSTKSLCVNGFYCDLESLEFGKVHFDHFCGVEMTCVVLVFLCFCVTRLRSSN